MPLRRGCAVICIAWSLSAVSVQGQGAQIRTEGTYPRYAPRGQTTVINVAVPSPEAVQAAEVSPAAGVTVASIKGTTSGSEQNVGWWEITLAVAADAAPGDRSLVLVMPKGRTQPTTVSIATHAPAISNISIAPPQPNEPTLDLQVTVADAGGDLGQSPYVWFTAECGGDPIAGALRGKVTSGVVHAALPNVRKAAKDGIPAAGKCDLQVHVTDSIGVESNALKTSAQFADTRSAAAPPASTAPATAEWTEFSSPEEFFTITFPGQPRVTETTWITQFGNILPARIYMGPQGSSRYSVTVVDYSPTERLLCERSRTLPALDLAIHDYGPGYWKTDVRGAVAYAASKYLERDAKMTSILASWEDLVQGLVLELANNADQSRTHVSIYMHTNRLIITEATVPKGYPAPLIFAQSLGWLDEQGRRVRYDYSYINDPNAPRVTIRGR